MTNSKAFGTEWTVRSRYETTDGDRIALMQLEAPEGKRTAVSYSYASPHAPQFIEYADPLDAFKVYSISYQNAHRRGSVAHREG